MWRQATHSKYTILITPASGAAHLSEQSRRPASNQRAADRAAVDPPFPAKSRSRQIYINRDELSLITYSTPLNKNPPLTRPKFCASLCI